MSWIDLLGYTASASVLLTFCMSTMVPLRVVAIGSNALFASFGAVAHIYPVLVLHVVLLPVNVVRLTQALRVLKDGRAAGPTEILVESLLPSMSRRLVKAGQVLITKGEKADRLYYLANGKVKIPELGKVIQPGVVLGEIGIFARDQERTATVVCMDDCEVYEMSESRAKHLFFQDKSFGLAVLQLIIGRLTEDIAINQAAPSHLPERQQQSPCELSSKDSIGFTQHVNDRRSRERAHPAAEEDFNGDGTTKAAVFSKMQKLSGLFRKVTGRLYEHRLAKAEREINRHRSFMRIRGDGELYR
jgi:CRP-like cAMP-binding protein